MIEKWEQALGDKVSQSLCWEVSRKAGSAMAKPKKGTKRLLSNASVTSQSREWSTVPDK